VDGMYKMSQLDFPEVVFERIRIEITCVGGGVNEVRLSKKGKTLVKVSKDLYRPLGRIIISRRFLKPL